jgi:hypothetical protein
MRNKDTILLEKALEKVTKVINEFHNEDEGYSVESQYENLISGGTDHIVEAMRLVSEYLKLKSMSRGLNLDEDYKRHLRDISMSLASQATQLSKE